MTRGNGVGATASWARGGPLRVGWLPWAGAGFLSGIGRSSLVRAPGPWAESGSWSDPYVAPNSTSVTVRTPPTATFGDRSGFDWSALEGDVGADPGTSVRCGLGDEGADDARVCLRARVGTWGAPAASG